MLHSNKLLKLLSISLLALLLTFYGLGVSAEGGLLIAPAPESQSTSAPASTPDPAAEQVQQEAIETILEPAGMMTIFVWSMAAALIMCAPVVVLVIIKRHRQK